jgi:carbonic anhydrase
LQGCRHHATQETPSGLRMRFPPRLIDGYRAFTQTRLPLERSRYENLAETGQKPEVMVICCCDSRVSPEVIFDARPGELFVVRNIANLVPPYSPTGFTHGVSAALEFAVQILRVGYIVVMGHSQCGGVRAFVEHRDRPDPGDFIDKWMALITPAARSLNDGNGLSRSDYLAGLERASVIATLGNLLSFPWISKRVTDDGLQLLGAYFDVGTGALEVYDPADRAFKRIGAEAAA